jgi:hypothetical protein
MAKMDNGEDTSIFAWKAENLSFLNFLAWTQGLSPLTVLEGVIWKIFLFLPGGKIHECIIDISSTLKLSLKILPKWFGQRHGFISKIISWKDFFKICISRENRGIKSKSKNGLGGIRSNSREFYKLIKRFWKYSCMLFNKSLSAG